MPSRVGLPFVNHFSKSNHSPSKLKPTHSCHLKNITPLNGDTTTPRSSGAQPWKSTLNSASLNDLFTSIKIEQPVTPNKSDNLETLLEPKAQELNELANTILDFNGNKEALVKHLSQSSKFKALSSFQQQYLRNFLIDAYSDHNSVQPPETTISETPTPEKKMALIPLDSVKGLKNQGVTCYFNAAITLLASNPENLEKLSLKIDDLKQENTAENDNSEENNKTEKNEKIKRLTQLHKILSQQSLNDLSNKADQSPISGKEIREAIATLRELGQPNEPKGSALSADRQCDTQEAIMAFQKIVSPEAYELGAAAFSIINTINDKLLGDPESDKNPIQIGFNELYRQPIAPQPSLKNNSTIERIESSLAEIVSDPVKHEIHNTDDPKSWNSKLLNRLKGEDSSDTSGMLKRLVDTVTRFFNDSRGYTLTEKTLSRPSESCSRIEVNTSAIIRPDQGNNGEQKLAPPFKEVDSQYHFIYQPTEESIQKQDKKGANHNDWTCKETFGFGGPSAEIYLSRFSYDTAHGTPTKIHDSVDLGKTFYDPSSRKYYEPAAFTFHQGDDAQSGHWLAAIKIPAGEPHAGQWIIRNDDHMPTQYFDKLEDAINSISSPNTSAWSQVVNASYRRVDQ